MNADDPPGPTAAAARPRSRRLAPESVHRVVADAIERGDLAASDRWAQARYTVELLRPSGRRDALPAEMAARLRAAVADSAENPTDLVVALGAGWGRPVDRGGGWTGRWPAAVGELIRMVRASLVAVERSLASSVPLAALGYDEIVELPSLFAMALLGGCDCDHHVRGCGRRCGRDCCYPDHDLRAWDPAACHLRAFVDQAVTGSARGVLQGGAFAESLLYRLLAREGRVVRRKVEFCRCTACEALYEGPACPNEACRRVRDETTVRVKRVNWLVTPVTEGGEHDEVVRCVCGGCGNLFRTMDPAKCPACGWRPRRDEALASVTVWTRVSYGPSRRCGRRRSPALDSH